MGVDLVAVGVFIAIAASVFFTLWDSHRSDTERRQRLEKVRRHS